MRPPALIKRWLSMEKMFQWLQNAPDESSYKRRLAVWLTHAGRLHANKVAEILGVSTQAVWLWNRQYNAHGPDGLERKGRGGRRRGFMAKQQEAELIKSFIRKASPGQLPRPASIKQLVEQKLGRKVSMPYIYRLLRRNGWAEIVAQHQADVHPRTLRGSFRKFSRPWLRHS